MLNLVVGYYLPIQDFMKAKKKDMGNKVVRSVGQRHYRILVGAAGL